MMALSPSQGLCVLYVPDESSMQKVRGPQHVAIIFEDLPYDMAKVAEHGSEQECPSLPYTLGALAKRGGEVCMLGAGGYYQ